jgi:hypothetical protein
VKHWQGSRKVYNMYLTTTTTPQWQHTDGSTRQATGTDHRCLGTCPNAAQVSLYPPQGRTRVAGWTTVPLPHEPPHRNWTACPSESSSVAQTRDSHTGMIQNTPAKTVQGVPCCMGSMWALRFPDHHVAAPSTIGIVAACVYVSLERPLYFNYVYYLN